MKYHIPLNGKLHPTSKKVHFLSTQILKLAKNFVTLQLLDLRRAVFTGRSGEEGSTTYWKVFAERFVFVFFERRKFKNTNQEHRRR